MAQGTVVQSREVRIMNFDPQRCFIRFFNVAGLLKGRQVNVEMKLTVQMCTIHH